MNLSLTLFQTAFGAYSRIMPSGAASRAVKLMTSPRIGEAKRNASRALFEKTISLKGGGLLSVRGHGPRRLLLMHGWSGWIGQFTDLIDQVDPDEYTIYAIHPLGHGDSYASQSHPGRFIEALLETHDYVGASFDVAVGHSLGVAALVYVQAIRQCFERMVLVSGPASIEGVLNRFANFINLGDASRGRFIRDMESVVGLEVEKLDLVSLAPSIHQPVLLIHDDGDKEVPVEESRVLSRAFPHSRLIESNGYGHSRVLQDTAMIGEMIEFIHLTARIRRAS